MNAEEIARQLQDGCDRLLRILNRVAEVLAEIRPLRCGEITFGAGEEVAHGG
ncbi:MAG: hypothetical protein WC683_04400 [bacterium]